MTILVRAKYLFDGLGPLQSDGAVVIDEERISAVGQYQTLSVPANADILDYGSCFVLPGFVDAHNHIGINHGNDEAQLADDPDVIRERARINAESNLRSGITTLREVGERDYLDLEFKSRIDEGYIPGPRLLTSGPWLTPTHGHCSFPVGADIVDGCEEVRKSVRRHAKAGVDWIKIMISGGVSDRGVLTTSYFTPAEINTAVEEAHNLGLRVAAHCYGGPGVRYAAEAGVDTLEHCARIVDEADIKLITQANMHMVLTPAVVYANPLVHDSLSKSYRLAIEGGAKIALGQDCFHGELWRDAELSARLGMSPAAVLHAITLGGAEACGVASEIGSLSAGKLADLVVLESNPFDDLSALRSVRAVIKGGRIVAGA